MTQPSDIAFVHRYCMLVFESLTSGVIVLDVRGCIVAANPAAFRHLELPEDALRLGEPVEMIMGEGGAALAEVAQRVLNSKAPVTRVELMLPLADGSKRYIGVSASPLFDQDQFMGAVLLFSDLTQLRELERAAEVNRQLAQIGELTAGVVHEFRNPLGVISGMAELIARKTKNDDDRESLTLIIDEVSRLERLVAEFLGFARPFELSLRQCNAEEVFQRAARLSARRALDKQVALTFEQPGEAAAFHADADKLAQALANLMTNAVDAAPAGGWVKAACCQEGEEIIFCVTDNGPGVHLAPGEDPFKPFFSMKEGGTGLGLAIVERIVRAHAGRVTFCNEPGAGARFEVRIPVTP